MDHARIGNVSEKFADGGCPKSMREGSSRSHAYVWIVLLAACLRIYWLATQPVVISNEGAEYARIAENLVKGNGYVGTMGGPQLIFPPLYPLLIAVFHFLVGNFELAGRLVSLIFGTCLVIPVYGIANLLHGRRVALIGAFLVAFHPILVGLSAEVYSEAPYATLLLVGVYCGLCALRLQSYKYCVAAGISLGLAHLIRPEAMVVPLLCVSALLATALLNRKGIRTAILGSALLAASFSVVIAPYVVFLTRQTGSVMLEGKHNINAWIRSRMNSGMSYTHAEVGVSRDLVEQGPLLNPNSFVSRSPFENGLADVIPYMLRSARNNFRDVFRAVLAVHFGYPILFLLIVIGLFRTPWNLQRTIDEGFLLLLLSVLALLILFGAPSVWGRLTFPMLPFLLVWAAKGSDELSDWMEKSVSSVAQNPGWIAARAGLAMRLISPVALLMVAALGFRHVGDLQSSYGRNVDSKRAGLWLGKYMPDPNKRIMDSGLSVAYYSGGFWAPLPCAEPDVVQRYIQKKSPTFIVLRGRAVPARPYIADWLRNGIPDKSAELIYTAGVQPEDQIKIYRWAGRDHDTEPISKPDYAAPPRAAPSSLPRRNPEP